MSTLPFLKAHDLTQLSSLGSEQTILLQSVTYELQQGSSYGLMGTSGSGKTTLLTLLSGLEVPTSGKVLLQGKDMYSCSEADRIALRKQLGVVFQVPYLIDELTLIENVMIKGLIEDQEYTHSTEKAQFLLEQVGLAGRELQRPRSLSGGEQQRVCIARALFSEPLFILADEPTAHLDERTAQECMSLLLDYQHQTGAGLLIATHDSIVLERLDVTLQLEKGLLSDVTRFSPTQLPLHKVQAQHG